MTIHRNRFNARAEAHQVWLRTHLLPRLQPGCWVPRAATVARWLGVDESTAGKHLRRALAAEGVVTAKRKHATGIRVFVVSIPEQSIAYGRMAA